MLASLDSGIVLETPDNVAFDTVHAICITGHREKSIIPFLGVEQHFQLTRATVRIMLYKYIEMAVAKGYTDFFSGLAEGTDLWAAEYLLIKKQKNSNIRLFGAMPYLKHSKSFSSESHCLLCEVEKGADSVILLNSDPDANYGRNPDVYRKRNYFMVDNASAVLGFFNERESHSGTAQTINYARKKGKTVNSFSMDDVHDIMDRAELDWDRICALVKDINNVF